MIKMTELKHVRERKKLVGKKMALGTRKEEHKKCGHSGKEIRNVE
jgi:hypothetical protein